MKAITCPQCGALVKTVSPKDKFAACDYCKAKISLPDDRQDIAENPEKAVKNEELTPYRQYQENYRKSRERADQYDAPYTYPQTDENKPVFRLILGFAAIMLIIIIISANSKGCLSRPLGDDANTPSKTTNRQK